MGEGGSFIKLLESGFAKASWPMVALIPTPIICMLAGASRMPPALFAVLNLGGTIAAIAIFRSFGDVFGGPIEAVTGFLNDYRLPIIAIAPNAAAASTKCSKVATPPGAKSKTPPAPTPQKRVKGARDERPSEARRSAAFRWPTAAARSRRGCKPAPVCATRWARRTWSSTSRRPPRRPRATTRTSRSNT